MDKINQVEFGGRLIDPDILEAAGAACEKAGLETCDPKWQETMNQIIIALETDRKEQEAQAGENRREINRLKEEKEDRAEVETSLTLLKVGLGVLLGGLLF